MDNEERDEFDIELNPFSSKALDISWELLELCRQLKKAEPERGRLWAIAATEAEKLHAWISYAMATVDAA